MRAELFQRPVGDVLATIRAVFVVGVEGKALITIHASADVQIDNAFRHYCGEQ